MNQTVVLTNTNWSKLRGDQGTSAELIIGRNWSPVEEAIGTSRLEWGGSSSGSRGRGAGAHGRLGRTEMVALHWGKNGNIKHSQDCVRVYLDNSRVLRERACWFGWFAHSQVLDVAASEDDVLEGVISRWNGPVGGPVLRAKGPD